MDHHENLSMQLFFMTSSEKIYTISIIKKQLKKKGSFSNLYYKNIAHKSLAQNKTSACFRWGCVLLDQKKTFQTLIISISVVDKNLAVGTDSVSEKLVVNLELQLSAQSLETFELLPCNV